MLNNNLAGGIDEVEVRSLGHFGRAVEKKDDLELKISNGPSIHLTTSTSGEG